MSPPANSQQPKANGSLFAFYGSLRRGMLFHNEFQSSLEFLYEETISGYLLYAMDDYPYAVRTGDPAHKLTVEVFRIKDTDAEKRIHDLELEVGYYYDEHDIRGERVGIYLFKKAGPETLVKSGDWVKFFGS